MDTYALIKTRGTTWTTKKRITHLFSFDSETFFVIHVIIRKKWSLYDKNNYKWTTESSLTAS